MSKEKIIESAAAVSEDVATISDKFVQYMNSAEEVIKMYGGDAAELGLNVLRIEVGYNLVSALLWLILSAAAVGVLWKKTLPAIQVKINDGFEYFIIGVLGVVPVIGVAANAANLMNVWNWVGLFWPEAYAVHKFLLN